MNNEKEPTICTTSGRPVDVVRAEQVESSGQHKDYIVLCQEERDKGFIRPYRDAYKHVGRRVKTQKGTFVSLEETDDTDSFHNPSNGYSVFFRYDESDSGVVGRYLKQEEFDAMRDGKTHFGGCGAVTTMGRALSETYARDPKFYGSTFCVKCNKHLPVAEFVWHEMDGSEGPVMGS